jgi:LPS-assembly protein
MFKTFLFLSLVATCAIANPLKGRYELYAEEVHAEGDTVIAEGSVVIYNQESVFSANKIIYNRKASTLELIGDVYVSQNSGGDSKNDYLKIDLKKDTFKGKKLFLYDKMSELWIRSLSASSYDNKYRLRDVSISSCDVKNPDWQFRFKKGSYYEDKEYVTLNHPTFYFKDVPLFYFPWLAFPTSTKRHTGLLKPYIGFENSENLLFVQPIFIAPYKNWDIELDPQIRLDRGLGLYSTLRFVDSNHSFGSVRVGIFDEKDAYTKEHKLKNSIHRGVEVKYQNSELLSSYFKKSAYKDALLLDFTNLNDIDFINLKHDGDLAVNKLVTSKLNYYITDEDDYLGLYAKYFIDTEKLNNDDTMQTLPSLQYHKFTKSFFNDNFLYGIDYKFKNNYRKEGLRAIQNEISIPIIYNRSFFDEFVNFSASENLYYSRVSYFEGNATVKDANYFSNYHNLSMSSDLSKKYDSFVHNMQLGVSYIIPSVSNKNGYFADFVPFNAEQKSVRIKFNEYLYDEDGLDFFTHRVTQNIYLENKDNTFDDLENEFIYKFNKDFYITNTLIYSYEYDKLKKIQSGLYYNDNINRVRMDHTFQEAPTLDKINYLTADFSRKIDRHYEVFAGLDYDLDESFAKEWRAGWSMHKKCWDYKIQYSHSVTPSLTSGGTESITRRSIYFFIRLANIGGVELKKQRDSTIRDENFDNIPEIEPEKKLEPELEKEPVLKPEQEEDIEEKVQ